MGLAAADQTTDADSRHETPSSRRLRRDVELAASTAHVGLIRVRARRWQQLELVQSLKVVENCHTFCTGNMTLDMVW